VDTTWCAQTSNSHTVSYSGDNVGYTEDTSQLFWAYWQRVNDTQILSDFSGDYADSHVVHYYEISHKERRRIKFLRLRQKRTEEKQRRKRLFAKELERRNEIISERRALRLFEDILGPEQRRVFENTGRLFVRGQKYGWLIYSRPHQIIKLEKDEFVYLCINLAGGNNSVPDADRVLAFGLMAKYDEERLNREANELNRLDFFPFFKYGIPESAVM